MMRSMYSAISSLKAHQFKMDTVGNNIANVNTVGFKGSRVTFKETFNQTIKGSGGAQEGRGGTNPVQIGLGTDVGGVDILQTRGAAERTDNATDLMINGEGFFMVSDDVNYLNKSYTRAGNFILDSGGSLVTQEGYKVLGYMADETGRLKSGIEGLKIDKALVYPPQATSPTPTNPEEDVVKFNGNVDSRVASIKEKMKLLSPSPATTDPAFAGTTGSVYELNTTIAKGKAIYIPSDNYKESIGRETTMEVFDKLGNVHQIKLVFTKKDTSVAPAAPETEWNVDAFYLSPDGNMLKNGTESVSYNSATSELTEKPGDINGFTYGDRLTGSNAYNPDTGANKKSFSVKFDAQGKLKSGSKMSFRIGQELTKGAEALKFDINLSTLTQFSSSSNASTSYVKGYKQGSLDSYAIASNGEVVGSFNNGQRRVLGRVALANFTNPAGLQKTQSNMFSETRNSGLPVVGKPTENGFAELNPGSLEMSNVDLGREFTNMIVTQRGFQANSRVITTTDQMLEELVNLKR